MAASARPQARPARHKVDVKVQVDEDVKYLLTVDGIIVPEAAHGYPRLVDPGKHMIVAHAEGYRDATQEVMLGEGDKQVITLNLDTSGKGGGSSSMTGRRKTQVSTLETALLIGGGATFLAGLTVGLIGVQQAIDAPTRNGRDALDARRLALAGDVMAGLGIVAAGTGLTLEILWPGGGKSTAPAGLDAVTTVTGPARRSSRGARADIACTGWG